MKTAVYLTILYYPKIHRNKHDKFSTMDLIGQFATSAARMLQNGKSECFNLLNFEVDLAYLWMKIYDNRLFCVDIYR